MSAYEMRRIPVAVTRGDVSAEAWQVVFRRPQFPDQVQILVLANSEAEARAFIRQHAAREKSRRDVASVPIHFNADGEEIQK